METAAIQRKANRTRYTEEPMMRNPRAFTDLTGIELPFVGAPMAGTSTPQLAAAVSNAGGLGSLGLAGKSVDQVREAIRELKTLTTRPFNLNFFCHAEPHRDAAVESAWIDYLAPLFDSLRTQPPAELSPSYDSFLGDTAMLQLLLEEKPAVVSFHFGAPDAATINALHDAGILLMASATNPAEARVIEEAGLDAVIATNTTIKREPLSTPTNEVAALGAGGLSGRPLRERSIEVLEILRESLPKDIAIISVGGVTSGDDVVERIEAGADLVQGYTAFLYEGPFWVHRINRALKKAYGRK